MSNIEHIQTKNPHIEQLNTEVHQPSHHVGFSFDMSSIINSNLINFIFVFAFIVWLIKKFNIAGIISNKQVEIKKTVVSLEDEKDLSEHELNKTIEKLKNLQSETNLIINKAKDVANNLAENINKEAQNDVIELEERAVKAISSFNNNVSDEIKQQVAAEALKLAEEHIKRSIDDKKHKQLINEFVENLDNLKV